MNNSAIQQNKPNHLSKVHVAVSAVAISFTYLGLFSIPKGHEVIDALIILAITIGAIRFILYKEYNNNYDPKIFIILLAYSIIVIGSHLIHGDAIRIGKLFLFCSIFYILIPKINNIVKVTLASVVIGSLAIGSISLYQFNNGVARPDSFTNAILFSQAAVILLLFNIYFFKVSNSKATKHILLISSLSSLVALYLSQSRGAWLALIAILGVIFAIKIIQKPKKYIAVSILTLLVSGLLYTQTNILKERIKSGVSDLDKAQQGMYNSSWGLRLIAWKSAWITIQEKHLIGVGKNNFHSNKQQQIKDGKISELAAHPALAHAHNQYLQSLLMRGVLGFIGLIALISIPFIIKSSSNKNASYLARYIALAYAVFGLSDVPFEHLNTTYLYVLSLIIIYSFLFNQQKNLKCSSN